MTLQQEEQMLKLNDYELFLQNFLSRNPIFYEKIIDNSEGNASDFHSLLHRMESEWNKLSPNKEFFFRDVPYYLDENYFIPYTQNVSIVKNLRYMPLILHSHQFIEVNYVMKASDSYYIDQQGRFKLQDGDVILSPPNFLHTFYANTPDSIIIDIIIRVTTFDTAFFNLLNNNNYLATMFNNALYSSTNGYILWHTGIDQQLKNLVFTMYDEWNNPQKYSDKMLEIIVMQFFTTLMRLIASHNSAIFLLSFLRFIF